MSEFLAEAQVVVRANTKLFLADFQKAVKKAEATQVTVTVRATMTGFRNDLVAKLKSSEKGLVVKVRVRPDFTGFRAALQAGALGAAKSVTVPVGPGGGKAAAAGVGAGAEAAGVVDRRAAAAQLALNAALDAGVASRRRITGALSDEEKLTARVAREELHLKASLDAVSKAAISGVPALLEQAQAEERAARAALKLSAAQQERRALGVPVGVSTADFKAQIAQQELLAAAEKKRAGEAAAAQTAETKASDARIAAAEKNARRLVSIEGKRAADVQRITTKLSELQTFAATSAVAAEGGGIATLRRQASEFGKAAAQSRKLLEAATLAGIAITDKDTLSLEAHFQALQKDTIAALEDARAQKVRLGAVRRAGIAQLAEVAGIRGAALTAATPFIVTSASLIAIAKAVSLASKLESELAVFNVTAGATADQMEKVRAKAVELGNDVTLPAVSADDAAVALTELSKAGLGVQDSMDGARGVLQLATAANIDFTQATQLAASALNAFGLAGSEAGHVADVLANSANESQGSITDAGVALQQSAAVARQAGLSLEQTVAALTLFARAGLRGSDAGTSLRTALIRLINPSTKAEATIKQLGLRIRDAQGNIDLGVFQQFTDATRKMSAAQRDQALAVIFGQDAIRGAAILAREGSRGLNQELAAVNKVGTASEVASARTSGFAGAVENLKNQISTLAEEFGTNLLPAASTFVESIGDAINVAEDFGKVIGKLRAGIAAPFKLVFQSERQDQTAAITGEQNKVLSEQDQIRQQHKSFVTTLLFGNPVKQVKGLAESYKNLKRSIQDTKESLEDLTNLNLSATTTIAQAREQVAAQVAAINANKISPEVANEAIVKLQALSDNLKQGDAEAQKFAKNLDKFIAKIQNTTVKPNFGRIPADADRESRTAAVIIQDNLTDIQVPNVLSGVEDQVTKAAKKLPEGFVFAGKQANELFWSNFENDLQPDATAAGNSAANTFLSAFTGLLRGSGPSLSEAFGPAAKQARDDIAKAFKTATTQGSNQQLGIDRRVVQAQIGGNVDAEIKAEQDRVKLLQREIARINKTASESGKLPAAVLKARSKAFEDLNTALQRIESLQKQQTTNAEQKARDAQESRDKADQAVLDALAPAARKLDTRALIAEGTESLKDNIAVAKAQQQNNLRQIAVIDASFKDRKKAAESIADLRDANIRLDQQIAQDTQSLFEAERQARVDRGAALQNIGDLTDNLKLMLRGFDLQIAAAKEAMGRAKQGTVAWLQAKADFLGLKKARQDALTQARTDRGEAIQSLGETTGSLKFLLLGIDIQISNAKDAIEGARRGTVAWLQAKVDLTKLKKARQDAINETRSNVLEAAFNLAEARGNKSLMLAIIDRQIAEAKKEQAQAKNLLDRLTAMGKVAELIQKKRDILSEDLKQDQGLTVFDLLQQARETFNANAGTLIDVNQTIAGATGFTANIADFFRRSKPIGIGTGAPFGKPSDLTSVSASTDKQVSSNNNLIAAIDRWIRVVENQASGNSSTVPHGAGGLGGAAVPGRRWFVEASWARNAQDS